MGCKLYLNQELATILKVWGKRVAKGVDSPWQRWHVICVYESVNLSKVGVNNMPLHLRDILNGYGPHIGITLLGH
jgi:hypothetical protein